MMKKEDIEKYIATLSPELQEKARACKNMDELKKFLAENDVELPEDVLQATAGGRTDDETDEYLRLHPFYCPECSQPLQGKRELRALVCSNPSCVACSEKWKFGASNATREVFRKG